MPNTKSAKKRVKTNNVRHMRNIARSSEVKSVCKKVLEALSDKKVDLAKQLLRDAEAKIARAAGKGLFKDNTASRKISRLAQKVAAATRA